MMKNRGGEGLVLAHQERHGPLPEGEGDEGALLQGAAVLCKDAHSVTFGFAFFYFPDPALFTAARTRMLHRKEKRAWYRYLRCRYFWA